MWNSLNCGDKRKHGLLRLSNCDNKLSNKLSKQSKCNNKPSNKLSKQSNEPLRQKFCWNKNDRDRKL